MNDRQLVARFEARVEALDAELRPVRPWLGRGGILERAGHRETHVVRETASLLASLLVLGALLAAAMSLGLASGRKPSPAVVTATEVPFPASYLEATSWGTGELSDRPSAPARYPTLDALVSHLEAFLNDGIKVPRARAGTTIIVPDGAATAAEVHLFATTIGGATDASSGSQYRLVAYHDARGWWFDTTVQFRVYCDLPLVHFVPPGGEDPALYPGMCLGSNDPDRR
jgi:hypothetical protein